MRGMGWRLVTVGAMCAMAACTMHLDKPVVVRRGDAARSIYLVDGAVRMDAQARARKVHTVDGDITLDRWAQASALRSVDGAIVMAGGASCSGDVHSVDGRIDLGDGVRVGGNVGSLTGDVEVRDALVEGRLETISGRIRLSGKTHVDQGIVLSMPNPRADDADQKRLPVVVIGPGVVVGGRIVARRGGTLMVSRRASIGPVEGIRVQWFDGAMPPPAAGAAK